MYLPSENERKMRVRDKEKGRGKIKRELARQRKIQIDKKTDRE